MIELIDVHKIYTGKKGRDTHALKGVSHKFPQTGLVFIVGKSGCGKSTLLNLLGLLDSYNSGQIIIGGKPISEFTAQQHDTYRALNIGFVFQEFHIIEKYTISKNISLALEIGQKEVSRQQIATALKKVGLAGFENRFARNISGGQKQRVAIARAIIKNPKIILADEPTGNLDSVTSREIFELLRELSKDKLVIVISHDIESAHRYADQIIELNDGKIVDVYSGDGTTDTVRMAVDNVDKEKVDKLLDGGKKVILVKKTEQKPVTNQTTESKEIDLSTKAKLSFRSSLKLSMLSIRSKWVRMIFTVLLSMFAIAFFGFADIIGQYDTNKIMAQEIHSSGLPFIPIGMMETDESSFITTQERRIIAPEHLEQFDILGLPYAAQYVFQNSTLAPVIAMQELFSNEAVKDFYLSSSVTGVIEADIPKEDDQPNSLGLYLSAGRWPRAYDEVVITNYQLYRIKTFGFVWFNEETGKNESIGGAYHGNHGINFETVQNKQFEEVISLGGNGEVAHYQFPTEQYGETRKNRIVGMINFDLSDLMPVLEVYSNVERATPRQRQILKSAVEVRNSHLNNYFVMPGYYHNYMRHNAGFIINADNTVASLSLPGQTESVGVISATRHAGGLSTYDEGYFPLFLPDELPPVASSDPSNETYEKKQVIISSGLLWNSLPPDLLQHYENILDRLYNSQTGTPILQRSHFFVHDVAYLIAKELDLFNGGTMNFTVNATVCDVSMYGDFRGYEIVGILRHSGSAFFPTQNFIDQLIVKPVWTILVPANTYAESMNVLNALNRQGRFTMSDKYGETTVFDFVVWSDNARDIYRLDIMFGLFIDVFRLAALLFAAFAILLTYWFIASSINARKKDIGILRSLGARKKDIAGIFIKEGVFIIILKTIFASLTCFIGFHFLNSFFASRLGVICEKYTLISFGIRQILLMTVVTIAGVAISIFAPILRISKKQPVALIRDEEI